MVLQISLFFLYLIIAGAVIYYFRAFKGKAWWVKIVTQDPPCLYFFGPFESSTEAASHQQGYIEDLQAEGASGIQVSLQKCQPKQLTVTEGVS